MSHLGTPIIKIELEGMKQSILSAFTEEMVSLDADFRHAVDEAVSKFDIRKRVYEETRRCLDEQLRRSVESVVRELMTASEIRDVIRAEVAKVLKP